MQRLLLFAGASALVAISLACAGSGAPDAPPVEQPTATPPPIDPELSDAMDRATTPEVQLGGGHCAPEEATWFSCAMKGGKVASVCGPEDAGQVTYRFGRPGNVELEIAGEPVSGRDSAEGDVMVWTSSGMRSEAYGVTFRKDAHRYEVSTMMIYGYEPDGSTPEPSIGVSVYGPDDARLVHLDCEADLHLDLTTLQTRVVLD